MLGNQQEDAASCWLPSPCQSAGGLSEIEEYFMYTFLIMLVACGENSTISYLMGEQSFYWCAIDISTMVNWVPSLYIYEWHKSICVKRKENNPHTRRYVVKNSPYNAIELTTIVS